MAKPRKPHINLIVLLFVTIAFAVIIQYQTGKEQLKPAPQKNQDRPDFFLKNATTKVMDETGKIRYKLEADNIYHTQKQNESKLSNPKITAFNQDNNTWVITAKNGTLPDHKEHLTLDDNVVTQRFKKPIETRQEPTKSDLTANTKQLTYYTKNQNIVSEGNVIITTDSTVINGGRMAANIPANTMEITTNVKASIKPKD